MKEKLEAPRAAEELFDELINKLDYIGEAPFTRPLVQDKHLASLGIRSIKIKNYVLYFSVDEESNTINAIRFLYNKRNWIKILKENTTIEEIMYSMPPEPPHPVLPSPLKSPCLSY
ncbi:type II toxin-antitoxin system RelE/ParE family toxin [Breznakiellaceae bacterium SP9]